MSRLDNTGVLSCYNTFSYFVNFYRLQTYKAMGDYSHLKYRMPTGNVSYSDFITESYNVEFMTMCIVFIFLGSFGMFLNGKKICQFFQSKTVSIKFN